MLSRIWYLILCFYVISPFGYCGEPKEDSLNETVYGHRKIFCYSEIDSYVSKENVIILDELINKINQNLKLYYDFYTVTSKSRLYNYMVLKSLNDSQIRKYYGIIDSVSYTKAVEEYLYFFPIHEDSQEVFKSDEFNYFFNEYISLFKDISALFSEMVNKYEITTSFGLLNLKGITTVLIHKDEKYSKYGNGNYYADLLIARMNDANLLSDDIDCNCPEKNCVGIAEFEKGQFFIYPIFYAQEYIGDLGVSIKY